MSRLVGEKREVGGDHEGAENVAGGAAEQRLHPADAPVDQATQDDDAADRHQAARRRLQQVRRARARQAAQAHLGGLDVDDVEQRAVGQEGRHEGVLDDFGVGDADILRDQEGGRPHDRRHELAVDAGRAFDRAGLHRRIADALHQGNGEGAGGHRVGDRGAGDHPGHAGGDHAGLRRTAAELAEHGKGELDEIVPGSGALEQAAEQHEQEHHAGRDSQRDAEDPFRGQPHLRGDARQGGALVGEQAGQPRAGEDVDQHDRGDRGQCRADGAPRGLQQQDDADHRHDHVGRGRQAGALRQLAVEHQEVAGGRDAEARQHPVGHRHAVARRAPQRRKAGEGQEEGEGEMDDARLAVVEHADIEQVGQGRCVPELEQRPAERDGEDQASRQAGGLAAAGIRLRDHGLQRFARSGWRSGVAHRCPRPVRGA